MRLNELLDQVTFQQGLKVAVSALYNEGHDLVEVKALRERFWGWDYEVTWLGKTDLYDIVIHIRP